MLKMIDIILMANKILINDNVRLTVINVKKHHNIYVVILIVRKKTTIL